MKKIFLISYIFLFAAAIFSVEIDPFEKDFLLSGIYMAQPPIVKDDFVVFTADTKARHVGIVFENEKFKKIHSFERFTLHDEEGETKKSFLFYIYKLPKKIQRVDYRLVIDGLWTYDPINQEKKYDMQNNLILSTVAINPSNEKKTEVLENGIVRFVAKSEPGEVIRLSGSFNNWDSYIYVMQEVERGIYTLEIPLPKGVHYYNFYRGITSFIDEGNRDRAYTQDGMHVSILELN
ncbi:MAG: glycogen-binding domain-containing protein [Treponemataceae bacterium]